MHKYYRDSIIVGCGLAPAETANRVLSYTKRWGVEEAQVLPAPDSVNGIIVPEGEEAVLYVDVEAKAYFFFSDGSVDHVGYWERVAYDTYAEEYSVMPNGDRYAIVNK